MRAQTPLDACAHAWSVGQRVAFGGGEVEEFLCYGCGDAVIAFVFGACAAEPVAVGAGHWIFGEEVKGLVVDFCGSQWLSFVLYTSWLEPFLFSHICLPGVGDPIVNLEFMMKLSHLRE